MLCAEFGATINASWRFRRNLLRLHIRLEMMKGAVPYWTLPLFGMPENGKWQTMDAWRPT